MRAVPAKRPHVPAGRIDQSFAYVPLSGGIDTNSSPLNIKPGRMLRCQNFEIVYGRDGYRRVDGYERYDGRTYPSSVAYQTLAFDAGSIAISIGDIVTGPAASGEVVWVTVSSGTWAGSNAAGELVLMNVTGTFSNNDALQVGGVTHATAADDAVIGTIGDPDYALNLALARESQRAKIGKPPGSGPVRGVAILSGTTYAIRDVVAGTSATIWKATASGWVSFRTGLAAGGTYRIIESNFEGASSDLALYGVSGTNRPFKLDGVRYLPIGATVIASSTTSMTPATGSKTFTIAENGRDFIPGTPCYAWSAANIGDYMSGTVVSYDDATDTLVLDVATASGSTARTDWRFSHIPSGQVWGSTACSGTSLAIGTGSKAFAVLESARDWPIGTTLVARSSSDMSKTMTGTVTAYSGSALTLNVTATTGSGTVYDWEIGLADFSDLPYEVSAFKLHLFLVYPDGQLQHSNQGDPLTHTSTASLIATGDEITNLQSMVGGQLAIFGNRTIQLLTGTGITDWERTDFSQSVGAKRFTVADSVATVIYVSDKGVETLSTSQRYGGFEPAIVSESVKRLLDPRLDNIVACRLINGKNQYRIYFDDGTGITACWTRPRTDSSDGVVEFSQFAYDHVPYCFFTGKDANGTDVHMFGTTDGWVMQEDSGTSFDGGEILSAVALPFNAFKSPAINKRFRKIAFEIEASNDIVFQFRLLFDYADGDYPASIVFDESVIGAGGVFNESAWNTVRWSAPAHSSVEETVDGVGKNMGLIILHESGFDDPFTLQGLIIQYSMRGMRR